MLSYQHIYHAGNLADVHKHALLGVMLGYMAAKQKPLCYIETHAGRGLYLLDAPEARKTGEAAEGVARLEAAFPPEHPYRRRLSETRARYGVAAYPGSPLIAAQSLREGDVMLLAEVHPKELAALRETMRSWGAHVRAEDGFAMASAVCPPTPRRGLMLVDPSYEVKDDYTTIPLFLAAIHRKWNVGVLMLWYPILVSGAHAAMLAALSAAFPLGLQHEVRFPPARAGHRMVGSGVFVVNPPFGTGDEAARLTRLFDGLSRAA
jgi:23S rRNA (adenine2030-N6)-methyltransferase